MTVKSRSCGIAMGLLLALTNMADAGTLRVTITNNSTEDGLYLTPLFSVFHNGSFDPFDAGETAKTAIEDLAEEGDASGLIASAGGFTNGVITSPGGFPGAPVIDPGETASLKFDVTASERYFSFASMVIPSNDLFIGNDNPLAYEVFDANGRFTNIAPIAVFASEIWDAGTEVNNNLGAAFNAAGGTATDETNPIALAGNIDFLLGETTADGTTVTTLPTLLATISIEAVPLPAGMPLLAVGLGAFAFARRRKT